jgi:hypothetical protein
MKFTWFVLPVLLAAGLACTLGSRLPAEMDSISSRSRIEAIVAAYKGGAAGTALLATSLSSFSRTAPTHLARSMWGE